MAENYQPADLEGIQTIYLMGICGTGVGALAGLLKSQGYQVRGSDAHVYPPMSDKLAQWGIEVFDGYKAENLKAPWPGVDSGVGSDGGRPDFVIVGNVIRRDNPEAVAMREMGIPHMSMPQAVGHFGIGERHSLVCAGTHGKTTTSSLAAHVLMHAGKNPSYLVGGALVDYPESFRSGEGDVFVIEGDEYDTAYFDKGSKFLHYRPKTLLLTSLEFDHADIFDSIEAIEATFAKLLQKLPANGNVVVWQGAERAMRLVEDFRKERQGAGQALNIITYHRDGDDGATLYAKHRSCGPAGLSFEVIFKGESLGTMTVPLWGDYSVDNVLGVIGGLLAYGLSPKDIAAGLKTYGGVRRRMEVVGKPSGITIVDDFAHHPTAVYETLKGARMRWPDRRIWAIFEPRSATNRRNTHQEAFVSAFAQADRVIIGSHERLMEVPQAERFDPQALARSLSSDGTPSEAIAEPAAIKDYLVSHAKSGDVLMVLSNGDFGGLHGMLKTALAKG